MLRFLVLAPFFTTMKHIVVLNITDFQPHKSIVIEEPPMILTWRGMFFQFKRKMYFPKNCCTKYIYNEVSGCSLASISTSDIVEAPEETKESEDKLSNKEP
jgi:hypothetical protein